MPMPGVLNQKHPAVLPAFTEIKDQVLARWQQQQSQKANDETYERLLSSYQIERVDGNVL